MTAGERPVVLVTGGAGFIGSHVVDRLAAAGYRPRILDARRSPWPEHAGVETVIGDVRRLDDVREAARGCAAICHLAAAADVSDVLARPAWSTELNSLGTLNVLEAARELETPRVVYASTVWVYSDVEADEVDEDVALRPPAHLYTAGKLSGELYCRSYAALYDVASTVVRFGIPYGPRARPAAVIPSFVDRALRGEPLTIAGSGEQERSFVYVGDLADGVVRALVPEAAGRTYNLGSDETTTIRGLAEIVRDVVAPVEIVHSEGRPGDLRGATIRNDRAALELGWRARTPLREGVAHYARWVQEQAAAEREAERLATADEVAAAPPPVPVPGVPALAATAAAPQASASDRRGRRPVRRAASRVSQLAGDRTAVGFVSSIAIVSTLLPTLTSTHSRADAAGVMTIALLLLLPLWTITTGRAWRPGWQRLQAGTAAAIGVLGVLLSTSLSTDQLVDIGHARLAILALAALLVWTLVGAAARSRHTAEDRKT